MSPKMLLYHDGKQVAIMEKSASFQHLWKIRAFLWRSENLSPYESQIYCQRVTLNAY
jgi:hypothetical protein